MIPQVRHRFAVWCLRLFLKSAELRGFAFGTASGDASRGPETGRRDKAERPQERSEASRAPKPPPGDGPIIEGEFERLDERTVDNGRDQPGRDRPGRDNGNAQSEPH